MKLLAELIRRVLDSTYLGGGASLSTITGPSPTIHLEISAGDLFVNSRPLGKNGVDDELDQPLKPTKVTPSVPDPKVTYAWETGSFGPKCPKNPCATERPVIQIRFVRCTKKTEGSEEIVEADESNCKDKKPDELKICPKCVKPRKPPGTWSVVWDADCSVECGMGIKGHSIICENLNFVPPRKLPEVGCAGEKPTVQKNRVCMNKLCPDQINIGVIFTWKPTGDIGDCNAQCFEKGQKSIDPDYPSAPILYQCLRTTTTEVETFGTSSTVTHHQSTETQLAYGSSNCEEQDTECFETEEGKCGDLAAPVEERAACQGLEECPRSGK